MNKREIMEHPEYGSVPELLKNAPFFNFELYLKNKNRSRKERWDEIEASSQRADQIIEMIKQRKTT